jgi:hypothetical protein
VECELIVFEQKILREEGRTRCSCDVAKDMHGQLPIIYYRTVDDLTERSLDH